MMSAASGWNAASDTTPTTAMSSPDDAAMLVAGSGEVLIASRRLDFTVCESRATSPPVVAMIAWCSVVA